MWIANIQGLQRRLSYSGLVLSSDIDDDDDDNTTTQAIIVLLAARYISNDHLDH